MTEDLKDPDFTEAEQERNDALKALRRARRRAEELALRTGTALIQAVDGKPVRVLPRSALSEDDRASNAG